MFKSALLASVLLLLATGPACAVETATIRVDYYHTGNALTEIFSLHRVVIEPLPWPGNPEQPVDNTNRGLYRFDVVEPVTHRVLYSRGFSSIFGEWQTVGEAKKMHRTFHESVRFPRPEKPVRLRISKRDDANRFAAVWSTLIDPEALAVVRQPAPPAAPTLSIMDNGPPAKKVDYLIIGDGYSEAENAAFRADAERLVETLFDVAPFRERRDDFNVRAINPPAPVSGSNRPSNGTFRWSPTGTTYDAFGAERYVLAFDNEGLRDIAQYAPYDFLLILTNSETYGGGGIFGLYSTAAARSAWAPYLVVHEFGHHFADLADEYYTSPDVYEAAAERIEPWAPNVTALHDPDNLKWASRMTTGIALPTPWPKAEFEAFQKDNQARRMALRAANRPESEMNALFDAEQAHVEELFGTAANRNAAGAFEGANYEATGYYRSEMNCLMFTRSDAFCRVCRDAIEEIIDLYTR